jgi:hypothetical protein
MGNRRNAMAYVESAVRNGGNAHVVSQSYSRAGGRLFAYAFFALSFVFTGALVVGLIH